MLENSNDNRELIKQKIIELYNSGLSYSMIADEINEMFDTSGTWNRPMVGNIIRRTRINNEDLVTRPKDNNHAHFQSNADVENEETKDSKEPKSRLMKRFGKELQSKDAAKKDLKSQITKTVKANNDQHVEGVIDTLNEETSKDEKAVLEAFGYDAKKWRIKNSRSNSYQMQGAEGVTKTFFQFKIDVTPVTDSMSVEDIATMFNTVEPVNIKPTLKPIETDRNLVLSFADLHFGITKFDEIEPLLDDLLNILSIKQYSKIRIEQLGDLFHSDMFTSIQTAKATLLSTDGKGVDMEKAVKDALRFYEIIINACLDNSSDVQIFHTQGNHSPSLEYMFLVALQQKYPDLVIHKNIEYRTAYRIDNVGILIAHGDTAKNKLPMLFANEFCDIWGDTKYREIHTGHYHFETVKDDSGVVQRQMGTPKPSDGYEKKNGFTMAHKKLQAFEYDSNGLKVIYNLGL